MLNDIIKITLDIFKTIQNDYFYYLLIQMIMLAFLVSVSYYFDTKYRNIPNNITYSTMIIGILAKVFFLGAYEAFKGFLFLGIMFCILLILYYVKSIGGGDLKLIMAISILMGLEYTAIIFAISLFIGVFYTVIKVLQSKKLKQIRIPLGMTTFWAVIIWEACLWLFS